MILKKEQLSRVFALVIAVVSILGLGTLPASAVPAKTAGDHNLAFTAPPQPGAHDKPSTIAGNPDAQPPTPCTSTCYMYAGARVGGPGAPISKDGIADYMTIGAPTLKQGTGADMHTLAELAAESTDGQQIVELGWNVDKSVNGDLNPHLFVYRWVNGVAGCYNGCGWVDYSTETTYNAGTNLSSFVGTTVHTFEINQSGTAWWLGFDPGDGSGLHWLGYFPDTLWTSPTFTKVGQAQVYGEIVASNHPTCTDMGNGLVPSATVGALASSFNTLSGSTWSLTALPATFQDTTNGYTVYSRSSYSFAYGGGGSPQAVGC